MQQSDIEKISFQWYKQMTFIRHLDGDPSNDAASNLQYVSLYDAMKNIGWKVDWDMYLTRKQRCMVLENHKAFAQMYAYTAPGPHVAPQA